MKKRIICLLFFAGALTCSYSMNVSENFLVDFYKDPSGTNAEWNTSDGVLRLPRNISKILENETSTCTVTGTSERGWKFSVKEAGRIIALGRYSPLSNSENTTVHLWSDEGVCLATAAVSDSAGWSWADIPPVSVSTSSHYRVSVVCPANFTFFSTVIPFENQYLKLSSACFSAAAEGFPSIYSDVVSGAADVLFRTNYKTQAYGESSGYDTGAEFAKYLSYSSSQNLNSGTVNYFFSFSPDKSNWSSWKSNIGGFTAERYVKWRIELITPDNTKTPEVSALSIYNNSFPAPPELIYPPDEFYTNLTSCTFSWNNAYDPDSSALTYKLQLDDNTDFSSPDITIAGISTCTITVTGLSHGRWKWRALAKDDYDCESGWSDGLNVFVDTMSPFKTENLNASSVSENGAVKLRWTSPVDYTFNIISEYAVYIASSGFISPEEPEVNMIPGPAPPLSPGNYEAFVVSGLAEGTTYFFALQSKDCAGNVSELSNVVSFLTNAPPEVTITQPAGSEVFSKSISVGWSVSDPNPEDIFHDVKIFLSKNSGISFEMIEEFNSVDISQWEWNATGAGNGSTFRLKISAADSRGLEGVSSQTGDFTINDNNTPPSCSLIKPVEGSIQTGDAGIEWNFYDGDSFDRVYFDIYISSDGAFQTPVAEKFCFADSLHEGTTAFILNTSGYPDGGNYSIRIVATDGILSSETVSGVFSIWNTNRPPLNFSLVEPEDGSTVSALTPTFRWEAAGDPDTAYGDELFWHLYVYTSTNPETLVYDIPGISTASFTITALNDFTTYFWRVEAEDSSGEVRLGDGTFSFYVRWSELIFDGEAVKGYSADMPASSCLAAEEVSNYDSVTTADERAGESPAMKLLDGKTYKIELKDSVTGEVLDSSAMTFTLIFSYDGLSVISPSTVKVFRLGQENSWEFMENQQIDRQKKQITVTTAGLSYFRLLSYAATLGAVGEVRNFPNPFNPPNEETEIEYVLTVDAQMEFEIFSPAGELVKKFSIPQGLDGSSGSPTGITNTVRWDGKNGKSQVVSSGIYILRLTAKPVPGGVCERKRLIGVLK
ncbi:MAG: DUF4082 domain-containing protein [bacterium]